MSNRGPGFPSVEAMQFLETYLSQDLQFNMADIDEVRKQIFEGFKPASERAIANHDVTLNTTEIAGVSCMEIIPPDLKPERLIIYGYGGGYFSGSPFEDLPVSAHIAAKTQARLIAPHYSLAPEHPHPKAVEESLAVCETLLKEGNFETYAMMGESAGGNLALVLTQALLAKGFAKPVSLAVLSPWCDLSSKDDSFHFNDGRDPTLAGGNMDMAVSAYTNGKNPSDPSISPLYGKFDEDFPPTIITTGTRDLLMSQSVRLARIMRDAGASVDMRIWEGMWHVFEFYDELPEAEKSLTSVSDFINSHW